MSTEHLSERTFIETRFNKIDCTKPQGYANEASAGTGVQRKYAPVSYNANVMAAERRVVADQQKCYFPWGSGKSYDILSFRNPERIQPGAITKDKMKF